MKRFLLLLPALALALPGCSSLSRAVGGGKAKPDEFAVVTKPPLVVPPEYNLQPPRPGETREQATNQQAQTALLGAQSVADASDAEQALVAQAGGLSTDNSVRVELDREVSGITYKQRSFADRILFWRDGEYAPPPDVDATPLDPEHEAERQERIQNVTGGGNVEIERDRRLLPKLPGL